MFYTDIHCHMLCGTDDGARDEAMMYAMLDEAYRTGTRKICFTPHYHPAFYGHNEEKSLAAFEKAEHYVREKYADMSLALGNELGYYTECRNALTEGRCRLLGGRYLLVDFTMDASVFSIRYAMDELLSGGFSVILAHVERYDALNEEHDLLREWSRRGALLQMNASAFRRDMGFFEKRKIRKLLSKCPIHLVASDAHNMHSRHPSLAEAEEVITRWYGADVAEMLLCYAPNRVLEGKRL